MGETPLKSQGARSPLPESDYETLRTAYRARFGVWPPVVFMPEPLAISVMEQALKSGEALPPEAFPGSGCSCA